MAKLQIKKSNETGKVPQAADLDWGELAINYTDGKLFYKKHGTGTVELLNPDTNTVTRLRGTTSGTYTSGDLTLVAGTNITITQSGSDYTIASAGGVDSTKLPLAGGTLTGSLVFSGATGYNPIQITGGVAGYYPAVQDGNGRVNWYWNKAGSGSSPTFEVSGEDAVRLKFSTTQAAGSEAGMGVYYAAASTAGAAIAWTEVLGAFHNRFQYLGNTVLHAGNYSSYALPLSGGTMTGQVTIGAVGSANSPTLRLNTSTSAAFVHTQENLAANLTAGQHAISVFGKVGNTKNSGYIGYYWAGDASNSNFVTIGHWGNDDLFRVYADGAVTVGTNTVLHANNYNSYSPTLTGTGASGSWAISVTGTSSNVTGTVAIANGGTAATTAAGARTNLGANTVGSNLFTLANPSAITFLRINADNTVSTLDAATFRTAIGAGTVTLTDTQTLSNKYLTDDSVIFQNYSDTTRKAYFSLLGISPNSTRIITLPDASTTLVGRATTDTLTNKTFTDNVTFFQDNTDNSKKLQFELSSIATSTTRTLTVPNASGTIALTSTTLSGYGITDAYTKNEVDGFLQGLDPKASVRVATTTNITLSGAQTIDGIAVVAGDRVLVKDQTSAQQNGIYVVAAGAWTRAVDMDVWAEFPGAYVFTEEGSTQADFGYVCTVQAGGTLETTAVTWIQFNGAANITAGTGLTKSGNTISVSTVPVANGGTGATTAAGARTNLGASTVGSNLFTLANPGAITFLRVNADNTISTLDAATFRTAIGAGTLSSESDTLATVTGRGATTSTAVSLNGGINIGDTTAAITTADDYTSPLLIKRTSNSGKGALLFQGSDNIGTAIEHGRSNAASHWGTYLAFLVHDDNTSDAVKSLKEKVRINATGVGIGVTAPRAPLDLGSTNNRQQIILIGETVTNNRVGIGLDASTASMRLFTVNSAGQFFDFGGISQSDGSTWTRNHRLGIVGGNSWLNEQGGNVGIGTTSPSGKIHVTSSSITAAAPNLGWPVYNAEADTNSRAIYIDTAGNGSVSTAGQGATVSLILGQYYDSRVVITPLSSGGASPSDQGSGRGKDLMLKAGTSDNGVGYVGGRLYLSGGMGYTATGYNGNVGNLLMQPFGGNVGIGTTPSCILDVNGSSAVGVGTVRITNSVSGGANNPAAKFINTRGNHSYGIVAEFVTNTAADSDRPSILFYGAQAAHSWQLGMMNTNDFQIGYRSSNTPTSFNSWPTAHVTVQTGGNVGIGTTSPTKRLEVKGTANGSVIRASVTDGAGSASFGYGFYIDNTQHEIAQILANYVSSANSGYGGLKFNVANNGLYTLMTLEYTGKVGIGIETPSEKLEVNGNILVFGSASNTAGAGVNIWLGPANNSRDIGIRRAGNAVMAFDRYNGGWYENARFHASGNFSIGNATDNGYKLEVNGSFAATTKSFVIPHPTKPGKKLRYGSLEGPENGVYVRGRLRGTKIELPDYWTKLVDPDSITVQLTPHGRRQDVWVTKIADNCVYVQGITQPDCYYFIQAERVDVDKLQVEID